MMDEHTDIDSTTVLLEGQGLMGVAWRKIAKKGRLIQELHITFEK